MLPLYRSVKTVLSVFFFGTIFLCLLGIFGNPPVNFRGDDERIEGLGKRISELESQLGRVERQELYRGDGVVFSNCLRLETRSNCSVWPQAPAADEPPCLADTLLDMLAVITEVLTSFGVVHWLECGTLLGAHRSGQIIPWTGDADIAVFNVSTVDLVAKVRMALFERGYWFYKYQQEEITRLCISFNSKRYARVKSHSDSS
eukprot:TRINITY_DN13161_c0_g1_i1.p1 TRINITY_DN13161_c0_g1~~TRINITY_DN13161_c0_g1_i1.p1  ORF type:complete len:202 (-),score=19.62 TRINITY_DN13161_c0_g1_i1:230-835(-)